MSEEKKYVTLDELDHKLDKLPGRWEVRFLVLAGMGLAQILPAQDIAQAALSVFH